MLSSRQLDAVNVKRTYCSWKWLVGFALMVLHVGMQAVTLPFLDMTLIACNCATATIVNMILSTQILKEKFIWKYDLTAMSLIALGCLMIALTANTEQVTYSGEEITEMMLSLSSLIYVSIGIAL